jgi:hypothetical protein
MTDALVAANPDGAAVAVPGYLRPLTRLGGTAMIFAKALALGAVGFGLALVVQGPLFFAAWTVLLVGWVFTRRRRLVALLRRFEDDTHLLLAGELERATADLDALCRESRWVPTYHALFVFFRGVAELDAGHDRRALAILESVRDSGWFGRRGFLGGYRGALHGSIAVAHAMLDEHDEAAAALTRAHAELPSARRGTLILVDVIVHARAARYGDALSRIEADFEHAERLLPARRIRMVRVLQAFCETKSGGGEYRSPASTAISSEAVRDGLLRAALDRYAARWPELRAFLVTFPAA